MAYRSIKPLYISILLWITRLDILSFYILCPCPVNHFLAYVLRPVIASNGFGLASPFNSIMRSSVRITLNAGNDKSTSMPGHSRL